MLFLLFCQILISLCCLAAGCLFYRFAGVDLPPTSRIFVTGLVVTACAAQFASLFVPLNHWALLGYITVLIAGTILNPSFFYAACRAARESWAKSSHLEKGSLIFFLLFNALLAAYPIIMDDTGSYHIQVVRWLKTYAAVPGIANLHERFGFQSSLFPALALFYPGSFSQNAYGMLNSTVSAWLLVYLILTPGLRAWRLLLLLFFLLPWQLLRGGGSNANYDLVCTVILILLFAGCLKTGTAQKEQWAEWMLWICFLNCVRLMLFPFVFAAAWAALQLWKQQYYRTLAASAFVCLLTAVGFLARNYISSGYLFYPSLAANWWHPDWQVPAEKVNILLEYIRYFNRVTDEYQEIAVTKSMGPIAWIPVWFRLLPPVDKCLLLLAIGGSILFTWKAKHHYEKFRSSGLSVLCIAGGLALAAWFLIAPDPRFAYGMLLPLAAFCCRFIQQKIAAGRLTNTYRRSLLLVTCCSLLYLGIKIKRDRNWQWLFLPAAVQKPGWKSVQIEGIELRIPEKIDGNWNSRCYDTPLPCLYEIAPGLELRTGRLKDGFKINYLAAETKKP